jgi:TetR/AcrR family acrAB operon transcriptional repressor
MVRRTKTEAAATREALLDAALSLFRDRGVAQTSLSEVAAAAGLTRGAVYWHFRDKADLFDALCGRVILPMEAMLAGASEVRQADPLGALRTLAVHGLTRLAADARAQAMFDVVSHKCDLSAETAAAAERQRSTDSGCRAHVEHLLKQAVARGQLPSATDTCLGAEMMNAFMRGVMQQWVENPGAYDLARAAPAMVDSLLAGLVALPPRRARPVPVRKRVAAKSRRRA